MLQSICSICLSLAETGLQCHTAKYPLFRRQRKPFRRLLRSLTILT